MIEKPYTPQLGKLASEDDRRDAIHIALAPVVAYCVLCPGEHVGITYVDGGPEAFGVEPGNEHAIGIVDPFLTQIVKKGEKFWLFLYQDTVTSLRHVWTSPAFKTPPPGEKRNGNAE